MIASPTAKTTARTIADTTVNYDRDDHGSGGPSPSGLTFNDLPVGFDSESVDFE